ncbi:hypothetical protein BASA83_002763 [Batrachochytrium salamandrivorans]|nr:hypothetical protein BASA83_002763 [Batrachochytrium salamandrivorans]
MIIDVRGPKKDLSAYTMQQVTTNTNGVVYTPPPTGSGSHTIKLPCGSSVTIMTADQLGVPRLDVTLVMASGYQAPGALVASPILIRFNAFAKSWIVDPKNSLFDKSFRQTLPQINIPGTVCKIPANPKPIVVPSPRPVPPTLPEYKLPAPIPAYHLPAPVPAPASAPASASAPAPASTQVRATSAAVGSASVSRSASTTASAAAAAASSFHPSCIYCFAITCCSGYHSSPHHHLPRFLLRLNGHARPSLTSQAAPKLCQQTFSFNRASWMPSFLGSYVFSESGKRAYLAECNATCSCACTCFWICTCSCVCTCSWIYIYITSASAPGSTSAPAPAPGSTSAPAPAPASESDDESAPAPESDDESAPAPASASASVAAPAPGSTAAPESDDAN